MTDQLKATATVSFSSPESADVQNPDGSPSGAGGFSVSLDSEKNDGKSTFAPDESAYLIVAPTGDYTYEVSAGSLTGIGRYIPIPVIDTLIFSNSKTAELSSLPAYAATSIQWLGKSGGTPLIDGQTVTVPNEIVGVLEIGYDTYVSSYRLDITSRDMDGEEVLPVVVVFTDSEGTTAGLTVTFALDEDEPTGPDPDTILVTYTINVTSLCAEGVIEGVCVTQDGDAIGCTDEYGQVTFESYPGSYAFMASRTGYVDVEETVTLT